MTTRVGDGWLGWPEQAPFDRIIVTAAPPELPRELLDQLRDGGFLVAPIGAEKRLQTLVRVRRGAHGFAREEIAAVRFVPMVEGMPPDSGSDR